MRSIFFSPLLHAFINTTSHTMQNILEHVQKEKLAHVLLKHPHKTHILPSQARINQQTHARTLTCSRIQPSTKLATTYKNVHALTPTQMDYAKVS